MNNVPKIGQRVRYIGEWAQTHQEPVTGVVTAIYRKRTYCETDDDPRWEDDDFLPTATGFRPEKDWHVGMKVDTIPSWWPYPENDSFAPQVGDLEPVT